MPPSSHRHRRSIRLPGWDYRRGGAYFVTVCCAGQRCLFGDIVGERMELNPVGDLVEHAWRLLAQTAAGAHVNEYFVVMPNHVHGIVWLEPREGGDDPPAESARLRVLAGSLGAVVRTFKATSARAIHALPRHAGVSVWQRNYYETILRSDAHLERTRRYIEDNPRRWAEDPYHPSYRPPGGAPRRPL